MTEMPLRIALLGCGYASEFHLKSWRMVPGAEVVAVCDPDPAKRERRAREFGVSRTFASVPDLIQGIEVDAYDVATPPETHREVAEQLVGAGKPVLCQKPLAMTLEDARAIVDLYARRQVRLMVNENWRWRTWFQEMKRQIQAGAVGEPFYARLSIRSPAAVPILEHPEPFLIQRQPRLKGMPRLIILEFLVHHIDTMRFLFGDVDSLYAQVQSPVRTVAGETVVTLLMNQGPILGLLDTSWASYGYPATTSADTIDSYLRMYWGAINHFAECLWAGSPFQTDGPDNLKTLEVTFRAYESVKENAAVHWRR